MPERNKTDYQIRQIMKYNRDGSPDRQVARHQNLMRCVQQLQNRGYSKRWDVHALGKKEVSRLVSDWRTQDLSHRTIANRMVDIRWLANKVGRGNLIPSNKDIGIGLRKNGQGYGQNKAESLKSRQLEQLPERERLITELRREFGLRTQEALKFNHEYATRNSDAYINLKGSWTKGGRPRVVEIINERQRELLLQVQDHQQKNGDRSMIPSERSFKAYYRGYNKIRYAADTPGHGLRHHWAQERFEQASGGIKAPLAGGEKYSEMNANEQSRWEVAARVVNKELGHGEKRQDITATYIGQKK